ncbi:MAG: hypothetical protein GOMPHAMPRED_005046 [Gomphillus americanus]|uniref:Uncharacterized protein n=1 Tax=Gomphillus americanus TaxID=1940652 RepID=A0A8H3EHF0_9LECA|nr:MAG: hypothetical protein GOMPHAMPRED_005046 [Gomphillus americanus]
MNPAILPLTTTFTAPTSCFSTITRGALSNTNDPALRFANDASCIPSGAQTANRAYAFSPGLNCPYSWTTVWTGQTTLGTATETRAICCPVLNGIVPLAGIPFYYNPDSIVWPTLGCTAQISEVLTLTIAQVGGTSYVLSGGGGLVIAGINAPSVQIAWQSTDLSTTPTSSSSVGASETSITSGAPMSSDTSNGDSLSTGSKIAIGIVVPLAVLGLMFVTFLITKSWQRRRILNDPKYLKSQRDLSQRDPGVFIETKPQSNAAVTHK